MRYFTFLFLFATTVAFGGIVCPSDYTADCNADLTYVHPDMHATASYPHEGMSVRYEDSYDSNSCNGGVLTRIWYIDVNNNELRDSNEPSCTQYVTVQGDSQDVTVSFPENRTYTCEITDTDWGSPTYTSGYCDQMAISFNDRLYGDSTTSCYKIFREYTVINMCLNPFNGAWIENKRWEHTQVIKVVDDGAPIIHNCNPSIIGLDGDCSAQLVLTNSAHDSGICTSDELLWEVTIDMWGDGTVDYVYGYNEKGDFYLKPTAQNEEVRIEIPELVSSSRHKIDWNVKDACGNHGQCTQIVEVKDIKPPTPYCVQPVFISFDGSRGDSTIVHASSFDRGSVDNCGGPIRHSYSPDVTDTVRVIKCAQAGFQFARIYHTDKYGNQEYCQIIFFVFDNGSCNALVSTNGQVHSRNAGALPPMQATIGNEVLRHSSPIENNTFILSDHKLYEDYIVSLDVQERGSESHASLESILALRNYLIGKADLSIWQLKAADINADGRVSNADLFIYRDVLLGKKEIEDPYIITAEDSTSINNRIPLSAYDGMYDFYVTARANIIEKPKSRSSRTIRFKREWVNGHVRYSNVDDIDITGLHVNTHQAGSVSCTYIGSQFNNSKSAVLSLNRGKLTSGQLVIDCLPKASLEDVKIKVIDVEGMELRAEVESKDVSVYYDGFSQKIKIDSEDIDGVKLYTMDGRSIPVTIEQTNGFTYVSMKHKGVLIVTFVHENTRRTHKLLSY